MKTFPLWHAHDVSRTVSAACPLWQGDGVKTRMLCTGLWHTHTSPSTSGRQYLGGSGWQVCFFFFFFKIVKEYIWLGLKEKKNQLNWKYTEVELRWSNSSWHCCVIRTPNCLTELAFVVRGRRGGKTDSQPAENTCRHAKHNLRGREEVWLHVNSHKSTSVE